MKILLASSKELNHEDAVEEDHLSRLLDQEIDLFRDTLSQFLIKGMNGSCHAIATDAWTGANAIFSDEVRKVTVERLSVRTRKTRSAR